MGRRKPLSYAVPCNRNAPSANGWGALAYVQAERRKANATFRKTGFLTPSHQTEGVMYFIEKFILRPAAILIIGILWLWLIVRQKFDNKPTPHWADDQ